MGRFSQRFDEVASESRFSKLELEAIFTPEEEKTLIEVKKILATATSDNEASEKIQQLGVKAIKILSKLGKKALIG